MNVWALTLPAEEIKSAKGEQHHSRARQQGDEAQRTPQDCLARRSIAEKWFIGEILRVGIRLARHARYRTPCRPGKERHQLAQFLCISNRLG